MTAFHFTKISTISAIVDATPPQKPEPALSLKVSGLLTKVYLEAGCTRSTKLVYLVASTMNVDVIYFQKALSHTVFMKCSLYNKSIRLF